jgi:hypothetical protein
LLRGKKVDGTITIARYNISVDYFQDSWDFAVDPQICQNVKHISLYVVGFSEEVSGDFESVAQIKARWNLTLFQRRR